MDEDLNKIDDLHKTTLIVTQDTGKILGNLNRVFIDIGSKRICSLSFRRKFLGEEFFIDINQVIAIGIDVVSVISESSAQKLTKETRPCGEDLREFQGIWVYTREGQPVGVLTDIGFNQQTWGISNLYFFDHRAMPIEAESIDISHNRIVVPSSAAQHLFDVDISEGLLARMFGQDVTKHANILLERALRGELHS